MWTIIPLLCSRVVASEGSENTGSVDVIVVLVLGDDPFVYLGQELFLNHASFLPSVRIQLCVICKAVSFPLVCQGVKGSSSNQEIIIIKFMIRNDQTDRSLPADCGHSLL